MFIVRDNDFEAEYKSTYFQKAIEYFDESLRTLGEITEQYPQESVYIKLYEGYVYRNLYRLHKAIGDMEKTFHYISAASKSHETFYLYYKQRYPNDGYLIKHFGKEYYLDCAKRLKFVKDPIEKKIVENTIRSFLEKLETDSGRQHVVLKQLRSAFEDKFDS
jgi:tetratricopeptide (TPR) repeat protein